MVGLVGCRNAATKTVSKYLEWQGELLTMKGEMSGEMSRQPEILDGDLQKLHKINLGPNLDVLTWPFPPKDFLLIVQAVGVAATNHSPSPDGDLPRVAKN